MTSSEVMRLLRGGVVSKDLLRKKGCALATGNCYVTKRTRVCAQEEKGAEVQCGGSARALLQCALVRSQLAPWMGRLRRGALWSTHS